MSYEACWCLGIIFSSIQYCRQRTAKQHGTRASDKLQVNRGTIWQYTFWVLIMVFTANTPELAQIQTSIKWLCKTAIHKPSEFKAIKNMYYSIFCYLHQLMFIQALSLLISALLISSHWQLSQLCVSGCICPKGLLLSHDGSCIKKEQCSCVYSGKHYTSGESAKIQCDNWYVFILIY